MKIKSIIPEGTNGNWRVEKFTVSKKEADFANIRAAFPFSCRGQYIEPGNYTRLMRNDLIVMSDTPSEIRDHSFFIRRAKGIVLINGLGLGVVLQGLLEKENVNAIFVNEISEDVIKLVSPYIQSPKLTINHTDCLTWKPEKELRFNYVWHDIWDNIYEDNLPEMKKLHRRYGHWLIPPAFQESWGRNHLR